MQFQFPLVLSTLPTERKVSVLLFAHPQTLNGDSVVTVFGRADRFTSCSLQCLSLDVIKRYEVAMWHRRRDLRRGRQASLIRMFAVVFLCPIIKPDSDFLFRNLIFNLLCGIC